MSQNQSGEYIGHVLYARQRHGEKNLIFFIAEFGDVTDAEEAKAQFNRNKPAELSDTDIGVGLAHFHPHETDENKDFARITPKDGSESFYWHDMVSLEQAMEVISGAQQS